MAPSHTKPTTDLESARPQKPDGGPFHIIPLEMIPPPAYPGTYARAPTYTPPSQVTLPSRSFYPGTDTGSSQAKRERQCPPKKKFILILVAILLVWGVAAGMVKLVMDRRNGQAAAAGEGKNASQPETHVLVRGTGGEGKRDGCKDETKEGEERMSILPYFGASVTATATSTSTAVAVVLFATSRTVSAVAGATATGLAA